jgi:hypothetical protein
MAMNLNEITNAKNADGLSAYDKLMMNQNKLDEGVIILANMNIKLTTQRIEEMIDIHISEEELDYYIKNFKPSSTQIELVQAYLTRYFGSYRDLNLLPRKSYIHLLLLMKKKLLMDLGYMEQEAGKVYLATLPYLLTGNLSDKVSTRVIRNSKFIDKIKESYMYQNLINHKYRLLECIKPGYIMGLLSSMVNTRFTYCLYEYPELYGDEILYNENKVLDEMLFFLNQI